MDPATIAAGITALFKLFGGGGSSSASNGLSQIDPRVLNQLLTTMQYQNNRLASVEPIHNAAMAMAMRMAPGYAQQPLVTSAPTSSLSSLPSSGGGGAAPALTGLAAALGAANLARLINALKGLGGGGVGPFASGDNPGDALDPNPPNSLDPNYVPPGTQPRGSDFNFGVGGGNPSGPNLDLYSFFNPSVIQNPANPNAAAFGGAPIAGPNQQTAARRTFGGPLGDAY